LQAAVDSNPDRQGVHCGSVSATPACGRRFVAAKRLADE
jgi:hypothetical protein